METAHRELAGSIWFGDLSKGNRLAADSKWQAAEAAWDKVAREDPKNDGAWYNLGIAAEARGDRQLAHERYQRANQIADKGEYRVALQRMNESLLAEQLARQQHQRNIPNQRAPRVARQPNQAASYSGQSQLHR